SDGVGGRGPYSESGGDWTLDGVKDFTSGGTHYRSEVWHNDQGDTYTASTTRTESHGGADTRDTEILRSADGTGEATSTRAHEGADGHTHRVGQPVHVIAGHEVHV